MRLRWLLILWPMFSWCAEPGPWQVENEEEALFLRRISEFWQEGEVQIAKSQMEEFIALYPESVFSDALCAALGDLFLRENNHSKALSHYAQIKSPEFSHRVFLSRMQCLYELQWHATLADECETYLREENVDPEQRLHATYFLAIALYQQCLNASKEPDTLLKLAQRAQPYFATLFESELSKEVAQGFAHLCCILKDYSKASEIYLDLAKKDSSTQEEMLFQAALIQSEYNKELAIQTFGEIAKMGQKRGKEAAYNRLVLSFDAGRHGELVSSKEELLREVPPDRIAMARLFLGRSLLTLKKYPEAIAELWSYIENSAPADIACTNMTRPALVSLLEASYQANDLNALDFAISKLAAFYPEDLELPKARFSRAQVLKKNQKLAEARAELEQLVAQFPQFGQKAQALFELAHLDYQDKAWVSCRERTIAFVSEFPNHELAPFAWSYLVSSSAEIAADKPLNKTLKEQLVADLEALLNQKSVFSPSERAEWQFLLVKTQFELGSYEKSMNGLQSLLASHEPFAQEPNALLLQALCYRDGAEDLVRFCETAEAALSRKATLMDAGQIHASLFNAYLERSKSQPDLLHKGADHLYAAFEAKSALQTENLLWLADFYYNRLQEDESNFQMAQRASLILEYCLRLSDADGADPLFFEYPICKLAKMYSILGRFDDQIALLEKLTAKQQAFPNLKWNCEKETQLLLAEGFAQKGERGKAFTLFDSIAAASATVRSSVAASACLQGARLKLAELIEKQLPSSHPDFAKTAAQLKNLILQKTLANEPVHLEGALEYIELQTQFEKNSLEKRLALLIKTKADFEQANDILSKDYHAARASFPRKDKIFQGYMRLMEAEILSAQIELSQESELRKELQAKAKDLLLQIVKEHAHPSLTARARLRLMSEKCVGEAFDEANFKPKA